MGSPPPPHSPPHGLQDGGPDAWAYYRRAARPAAATAPLYAATHRVDRPDHPPLYCLREHDAVASCEEQGTPATILLLDRTNQTWGSWRAWP